MSIWFDKNLSVEKIKPLGFGTMTEYLDLEWMEVGEDFIKARLPVNQKTIQPYGLLHGGASCVLAETLGSVGSAMVIDHSKYYCVGLEINANHIRGIRKGMLPELLPRCTWVLPPMYGISEFMMKVKNFHV